MQEGTDKIYAELHNPTVSFGVDDAWDLDSMRDFADRTHELRMQNTHQPVPAPLSDDAKDAERYRWLRENWFTMSSNYHGCITFNTGEPRWSNITEVQLDTAIDAAKAVQRGNNAK